MDSWIRPVVGVSEEAAAEALCEARQFSLSFFYWMQTEAPRRDGGTGYRGLRLRGDVLGTADGLAKQAYYREGRRIRAEFTVLEQHIGVEARAGLSSAEEFHDSVGIGAYRVHPVVWNIGEASGALAAFALQRKVPPRAVRSDERLMADFQRTLTDLGVLLSWPTYSALTAIRRTGYRPPPG
jgi:hypothetical protein